ncbi:MGDG synthase family glycosyltransferase [Pseudonocardia dioxanivorans]|uniref:MGDG synthase family glycosyltransferase n=1 Tax=Pseudonocardia dioxanivorans TaxID=240495 RepID=UPI001F27BA45|nr:glycosyltransferase [Pseudonocardia dioxanivorans]
MELSGPAPDGPPEGPGHVLVLSAPVGEGHVAAARALATRMRALWPRAVVREVESTGSTARDAALARSYAATMRYVPGLYGVAYDALLHAPRAAAPFKAVSAARVGHDLAPLVEAERPDLVVSTYPMTTGGLAWLRRRGRLPARSVAVVTDMAVHPYWAWRDVDETWTLLESSREQALTVVPGADVRVAPAAVDVRFAPRDRHAARVDLGLPVVGFTVLVSGGSLGFGDVDTVVDAVLAAATADRPVRVVVLCGRNERLRRDLEARGLPETTLRAVGWTDRVPDLIAAGDVVLTTAGGVIATEALAVGRPVVFATPVAGHGRAGARLAEQAGLALACPRPVDVTATIARLAADPDAVAPLEARAAEFGVRDLDAALRELAGRVRTPAGRP